MFHERSSLINIVSYALLPFTICKLEYVVSYNILVNAIVSLKTQRVLVYESYARRSFNRMSQFFMKQYRNSIRVDLGVFAEKNGIAANIVIKHPRIYNTLKIRGKMLEKLVHSGMKYKVYIGNEENARFKAYRHIGHTVSYWLQFPQVSSKAGILVHNIQQPLSMFVSRNECGIYTIRHSPYTAIAVIHDMDEDKNYITKTDVLIHDDLSIDVVGWISTYPYAIHDISEIESRLVFLLRIVDVLTMIALISFKPHIVRRILFG